MTTFDPEKVREELRNTKREINDAEHRLATKHTLISFDAAKTRHALREAQFAVREMVGLLNANRGRSINFRLARQIWAAEVRVNQARDALTRLDPTVKE